MEYTDEELLILAADLSAFYGYEYFLEDARIYVSPDYAEGKEPLTHLGLLISEVLKAPIEEMPLLLNELNNSARILALWRLKIAR
jgi:hypothetical protein